MIAKTRDIRLILDNIRSVHNAGSIFRTAETLGITHIYCVGTTPTPVDRFGFKRKDFAKVALGAEEIVSWEWVEDSSSLFRDFKKSVQTGKRPTFAKKGVFKVVALEQSERSIDYKKVKATQKMVIILGNEVEGVSKKLLKACDEVAEITLKGRKESLNVSVAAGIFLYRLLDK